MQLKPCKFVCCRGFEGDTYAAARRAAEAEPLNAAARNAAGLAAESRGDHAAAQAAYSAAAALLDTGTRGTTVHDQAQAPLHQGQDAEGNKQTIPGDQLPMSPDLHAVLCTAAEAQCQATGCRTQMFVCLPHQGGRSRGQGSRQRALKRHMTRRGGMHTARSSTQRAPPREPGWRPRQWPSTGA